MGKASKALRAFIDSIPDNRLSPPQSGAGTIVSDTDFRLDMQGVSLTHTLSASGNDPLNTAPL